MSVLHTVKIDTRASEQAGKEAMSAFMRGVKKGYSGQKGAIDKQMTEELTKFSPFTMKDSAKILSSLDKQHMRAQRKSVRVSSAHDLQNRILVEMAKRVPEMQSKLQAKFNEMIGERYKQLFDDSVLEELDRNKRAMSKVAHSAASMKEQLTRESGMGFVASKVAGQSEYKKWMTAIDGAKDNKELSAIQDSIMARQKHLAEAIDINRKQIEQQKQLNRELREEAKLREKIANLGGKYLAMTGEDPSQIHAWKQKWKSDVAAEKAGKSHAEYMKSLEDDHVNYQQLIHDEKMRRKAAADYEKQLKQLDKQQSKYEKALDKQLKAEGMGTIERKNAIASDRNHYNLYRNHLAEERKDLSDVFMKYADNIKRAVTAERHAKMTGFAGEYAAVKDSIPGILARFKRAVNLTEGTDAGNMAFDQANQKIHAFMRKIDNLGAANHFTSLKNYLNDLDTESKKIIDLERNKKKQMKAFRKYRDDSMDELDAIVGMQGDAQKLRNKHAWLPSVGNKYVRTPFAFGYGFGRQDNIAEQQGRIARELRAAQSQQEIEAIRRKYDFEGRRNTYQRDITRFGGRSSFITPRDEDGRYLPSLPKMREKMMTLTRTLASAWILTMWGRMMFQPFQAGLQAVTGAADTYTRQKNMYNVALGYNMTRGKSFEQWEDESFSKARQLRMSASEYRDMVINAAPIFHTAVYGKDYKGGKIGYDGQTHQQGERIIKHMDQVEKVAVNLHRMAKVSGTTDVEMNAAMRQIIQIVSKGRANIQDIRPILESGGHMGDMIARFGFRAAGAADLYRLNEEKALTADKLLTNLLSEETTKELKEMQRRSARTWQEVSAMARSDFDELFRPTVRLFANESEYGMGDKILGFTQAIGQNKELGMKIRSMAETFINDFVKNFDEYVQKAAGWGAAIFGIAYGVGEIVNIISILPRILSQYFTDAGADEMIHKTMKSYLTQYDNTKQNQNLVRLNNGSESLQRYLFGNTFWDQKAMQQAGIDTTVLNSLFGQNAASAKATIGYINKLADMTDEDIKRYATTAGESKRLELSRERARGIREHTDVLDVLKTHSDLQNMRDETHKEYVKMYQGLGEWSMKLFKVATGMDSGISQEAAANTKKMENERMPPGKLPVHDDKIMIPASETAKNTRRATQVQIAILKQVAGTRTINRVVHVTPNIVANVGTIRNGIEYDQLLKDLGESVNHAVTAYAI